MDRTVSTSPPTSPPAPPSTPPSTPPLDRARQRGRAVQTALAQLVTGLGTAALALLLLPVVVAAALACGVGVGLLVLPAALRGVRALADTERARLSRQGPEVVGPGPLPRSLRAAVRDAALHRELVWVLEHATLGTALSLLGLALPLYAARELTFPAWWYLLPPGQASDQLGLWTVRDWSGALGVASTGLVWALATPLLVPGLARAQGVAGRWLLGPLPGTDLSLRVAQLTSTRAAALDAHAAELRRIERSLHDGSQNRLVAVTVLVGAARRALARDPATADDLLERAQEAAELALAELRAVVRGVLPPVLADRGLAGALTGLAAASPVPCRVEVDVPGRCAASVEATAYFVVAEALTNAARHSTAHQVEVLVRRRGDRLRVRVSDDGSGGAREGAGSGLAGTRRRVEAHDGTMVLTSPPGGPTTLEAELPCGS